MSNYLKALLTLNTDRSHKWPTYTAHRAPHKPFLIFAIMDGIEQGWINSPRIDFSTELIEAFFDYWNLVMPPNKVTTIALPLFHMNSEPFYDLHYRKDAKPFSYSPSLGALRKRVDYAILKQELFEQLSDESTRKEITRQMLETYFSKEKAVRITNLRVSQTEVFSYRSLLISNAAESFIKYHSQNDTKVKKYPSNVRLRGFAKAIKYLYKYRCAVCRENIQTPSEISLVEAAHIIPHSISNNDDPRNGLALCPSHHWMFDQFLFTVENDFTLIPSTWLAQKYPESSLLSSVSHKEIYLPEEVDIRPHIEVLEWHQEQFNSLENGF